MKKISVLAVLVITWFIIIQVFMYSRREVEFQQRAELSLNESRPILETSEKTAPNLSSTHYEIFSTNIALHNKTTVLPETSENDTKVVVVVLSSQAEPHNMTVRISLCHSFAFAVPYIHETITYTHTSNLPKKRE